jgi:hypothetical protein
VNHEERQKRIAEAAYYRSLRRGFSGDLQLDDWLAAEQELAAMAAEPQTEDDALPAQPDQTSGAAIPAPLAKEEELRAEEVKQSARDLTAASEAQKKAAKEAQPAAKKTRNRAAGGSTAELRRSV